MILPPELFELPRLAQELADANRAERERVARLEAEQQATRQELRDGFAQTGERLDRLDTRVAGVEGRLEGVENEVSAFRAETTARFNRTGAQLLRMGGDLGTLKGGDMEQRILKRVPQFRHLIPKPAAMTAEEVADFVDAEVAAGRLTRGEARQVERADVILRSGAAEMVPYLVLEISWLVQVNDVRRAHDRAALLRKAGYDALAAVAGTQIEADAVALAERLGVERQIDDELDAADGVGEGGD